MMRTKIARMQVVADVFCAMSEAAWRAEHCGPAESMPAVSRRASAARTVHAALDRLGLLGAEASTLRVHILGADAREGQCARSSAATFGPLLALLAPTACTELEILLCGPNCCNPAARVADTDGAPTREARPTVDSGPALVIRRSPRLYHELVDDPRGEIRPPHLAIALNAGLWGYDSWSDSIRLCVRLEVPLVVTAYNAGEADEDEDLVDELGGHVVRWRWRTEPNPWRSLVAEPRITREGSRGEGLAVELGGMDDSEGAAVTHHENAYWMCAAGTDASCKCTCYRCTAVQ